MSRKETDVVIVGAGLVGSLLSLYLARRGLQVDMYERRPDMRKETVSAGRSINLAISTRGLFALRALGLEEEILKRAIPMKGRMIHPVRGELSLQPYGKDDSEAINSISRGDLNRFLMTRAEASGKVRIHFRKPLVEGALDRGELVFEGEPGEERSRVAAQVIFGADGAHSVLRKLLVEQAGCVSSESFLDYGYKELVIPARGEGGFRMAPNALHIWPRGTYMLIALPNFDGSFTCTLFLPFEGPLSFASLSTDTRVLELFETQFPDAVPLMPDLVRDFFQNPTGQMVTVKSRPWHWKGRALLLGDAAHAIVPFFGQGMNCGFEDCTELEASLDRHGDWEAAFEDFTRSRVENADAIAEMALDNFIEMRDRVADPRFLLQREVEKRLQRLFPDEYLSRYQMVTFSRVAYRKALEMGIEESRVLEELTRGVSSADSVDLARAEALVRTRLLPLMREARRPERS